MAVAVDGLPFLLGEAGHSLLQPGAVVVVQVPVGDEQHLGPAVGQRPAQLASLMEGVEQHHQRSDTGRGHPADQPFRSVRGQQPHPAAPPHAAGQQGPAQSTRLDLQAAVAEAPIAQHHQIPVAPLLSQVAHEPVGRGRIARLLEPPPVQLVNTHSQSVGPAIPQAAGPPTAAERAARGPRGSCKVLSEVVPQATHEGSRPERRTCRRAGRPDGQERAQMRSERLAVGHCVFLLLSLSSRTARATLYRNM